MRLDSEQVDLIAQARVGTTIKGKWTLERLIGVGGMAAVYSATHRNRKKAALKILHPEYSEKESIRTRFQREGYVANTVGHSGVVRVDDDDVTEDGCAFLIMELCEGETLDERLTREGPLPAHEVLGYMDQVIDTVAAAHAKGIIHRDLKPENMLLGSDGTVKLLDFGIARVRELTTDPTRTLTEGLMGTPAFMPPEQARGNWAEVDAKSDLWSLGATMFTLLTGCHVHDAETAHETLAEAIAERAPSLKQLRPDLPDGICVVVDRALEYDKSARWGSASMMLLAVRDAISDLEATADEAQRAEAWQRSASASEPEIEIFDPSSLSPEPAVAQDLPEAPGAPEPPGLTHDDVPDFDTNPSQSPGATASAPTAADKLRAASVALESFAEQRRLDEELTGDESDTAVVALQAPAWESPQAKSPPPESEAAFADAGSPISTAPPISEDEVERELPPVTDSDPYDDELTVVRPNPLAREGEAINDPVFDERVEAEPTARKNSKGRRKAVPAELEPAEFETALAAAALEAAALEAAALEPTVPALGPAALEPAAPPAVLEPAVLEPATLEPAAPAATLEPETPAPEPEAPPTASVLVEPATSAPASASAEPTNPAEIKEPPASAPELEPKPAKTQRSRPSHTTAPTQTEHPEPKARAELITERSIKRRRQAMNARLSIAATVVLVFGVVVLVTWIVQRRQPSPNAIEARPPEKVLAADQRKQAPPKNNRAHRERQGSESSTSPVGKDQPGSEVAETVDLEELPILPSSNFDPAKYRVEQAKQATKRDMALTPTDDPAPPGSTNP